MSYPVSFNKTSADDYQNPSFQDRITPDIWFTRLNTGGGPLFNYKYYVNNSITPTQNILSDDFWYDVPNAQGGTIGVKWAILSSTDFPDLNAPGINTALFGTLGDPTKFFSFSQMVMLLHAMLYESSKPVSLVDAESNNEWLLENGNTYDNINNFPVVEGKDLACYIPAINKYFKINISLWGADGSRSISYTRTELMTVSNICFPAGTPIQTDQGPIAIEEVRPSVHSIRNKPIVTITKTITSEKYLVEFKKNSLGLNFPTQDTVMSANHKVYYQGKMMEAFKFVGKFEDVVKVKYSGELLYNVLMDTHTKIRVNNLICETLDPKNTIAKLYTKKYTNDSRENIIVVLSDIITNKKNTSHKNSARSHYIPMISQDTNNK